MSLIRRRGWELDPFREITRIENEMRKAFDNIFGNQELKPTERVFSPLVDLEETDEKFILQADLPGFKKEDITIEATSEGVEITAQHEEKTEEKKKNYIRRERRAYKFYRHIPLPSTIDVEKITSAFENGTLKLEFTKIPGKDKKVISLK
ncbi:MAG: Hsp20/alpha crystallin family protein [Promethearchaeota archaeon]